MPSLTEYFEKNRYQAQYEFGTRVFGKYKKIPFIGSIYGDSVISETEGPRLTIHLDLPIKIDGIFKTILIDTHDKFKDISELIDPFAPVAERKARAVKTHGSKFKSQPAHQNKEVSRSQTLLNNLKNLTNTVKYQ